MLYKKRHLIVWPISYLLMAGNCPGSDKTSTASSSENNVDQTNQTNPMLQPSVFSCKTQGTVYCMGDKKSEYVLNMVGQISDINPELNFQVAFIAMKNGADKTAVANEAVKNKGTTQTCTKLGDGSFVYWHKPAKSSTDNIKDEWSMQLDEDQYKELTSGSYKGYMLSIQDENKPAFSTTSVEIGSTSEEGSRPDYEDIGLEVKDMQEKNDSWVLKSDLNLDYTKDNDANAGFIILRTGSNLHDEVYKVMDSKQVWPTTTTTLNHDAIIIVPKDAGKGTFRGGQPAIITDFNKTDAPMDEKAEYKIYAYYKKGNHLCISAPHPSQQQFSNNNNRNLIVPDLKLSRKLTATGQVESVQLNTSKVEYSVGNQVQDPDPDLAICLVVLSDNDVVWRSDALGQLYETLQTSNSHGVVSEDGGICLINTNETMLQGPCAEFFSHHGGEDASYRVFACLFDKSNHKLKFYTKKEPLNVEDIKQQEQKKEEPKKEPAITLDNTKAHITLHQKKGLQLNNYAVYKFPEPRLDSQLNTSNITNQGYIINIAGIGDVEKNSKVQDKVQAFISSNKKSDNDGSLFIFNNSVVLTSEQQKADDGATLKSRNEFAVELYSVYSNTPASKDSLVISYWVQTSDGKITWSEPVSIELKKG